VAAEELSLGGGEAGGDVAFCKVEDASFGFGEEPLPNLYCQHSFHPLLNLFVEGDERLMVGGGGISTF
jgi:hypothetical protein